MIFKAILFHFAPPGHGAQIATLRKIITKVSRVYFESPAMLVVETAADNDTLERALAGIVRPAQGDRVMVVSSEDNEEKGLDVLRQSFVPARQQGIA